jgi:hypothetical protein
MDKKAPGEAAFLSCHLSKACQRLQKDLSVLCRLLVQALEGVVVSISMALGWSASTLARRHGERPQARRGLGIGALVVLSAVHLPAQIPKSTEL